MNGRAWAIAVGLAVLIAGPTARPVLGQPAVDRARAAFSALPEADRVAIQDSLLWAGHYLGPTDGAFSRPTLEAIEAFQRRNRLPATGLLDKAQLSALAAVGGKARAAAGFVALSDPATGIRIGIPAKLLPKRSANPSGGARFQSEDERVTLDLRAQPGGEAELKEAFEKNLALRMPGRTVTYRLARPDATVVSGETAGGRFLLRSATRGGVIRGFSIGYDKALAPAWEPVVAAIANSFEPFPAGAETSPLPPVADRGGAPAPPHRPEPGLTALAQSGVALAPRRVLTAAAGLASCAEPTVAGSPARVVRIEREVGLALLEPARPLPAAALALAAAPRPGPSLALFQAASEGGRVVASPGEIVEGGRFLAALQDGAAGAVVLDGSGSLAGAVVQPSAAASSRKIAGLLPPASHPVLGPADLAAFLGPDAPSPPARDSSPSLGALAAAVAPAIVRVGCAGPHGAGR